MNVHETNKTCMNQAVGISKTRRRPKAEQFLPKLVYFYKKITKFQHGPVSLQIPN